MLRTYDGREGADRRESVETACYDLLDSLGIGFLRADHERADTIAACEDIEAALGCEIEKNLFLCNRQGTEFYLLVMPGRKSFKTKFLSAQLGTARLSFAPAEDMERLLGVAPGSVSLLGLMNDSAGRVRLVIDRQSLKNQYLAFHPCRNTSTMRIKTADVLEKLIPALGHEPSLIELPTE